jgi:putative transposase
MTCQTNNNLFSSIIELITGDGISGMAKVFEILLNEAMLVERNKHLKAESYERTPMRQGYANGFKDKTINSRAGIMKVQVPQVRDSSFYPTALEKGVRSEKALKLAIAEMYVNGLSTRKVSAVVEELCGCEVSSAEVSRCSKLLDDELEKWRNRELGSYKYVFLDARYEKVRQNGNVSGAAVLVALGVTIEGKREILGVSVKLSEQEAHWRSFLQSLQSRGLHGMELFISDAHAGLNVARKAVFPSVPWQRCQFHLQQNAQSYVPKKSMKSDVAFDIKSIFNAPNLDEAKRMQNLIVKKYTKIAPNLAEWMDENLSEGFTVFNFPRNHWRKIRTNNVLERVNREIARRTKTACIFANEASCERLVTAVLVEISDEWQTSSVYLSMNKS